MTGKTARRPLASAILASGFFLGACSGDVDEPVTGAGDQVVSAAERSRWGGAEIYDEVCDRCHKMGVDGAPELGDSAAWQSRIAQGRDTLLQHVHEGFNKMPARGECDFCSDAQLEQALDYMVGQSR